MAWDEGTWLHPSTGQAASGETQPTFPSCEEYFLCRNANAPGADSQNLPESPRKMTKPVCLSRCHVACLTMFWGI